MITVERIKELARENYNRGGDTIVECYEDKAIKELIERGVDTEEKLLDWFQHQFEVDEELRKAALWHAYGTTDEKEIELMLSVGVNGEDDNVEYDNYEYDPCYGCQACDNSYNCKHCPHGDDGRYESPFDVYTPSELGISVKW